MKRIKILLTVITVFALLFTVASAAGSPVKFADSVTYTEGENLVISIYGANGDIVTAGGYFGLEYDADVWEFASWTKGTACSSDMNVNDYSGEVEICPTNSADVTLTADAKICDIVFTYKAGEAVGSEFSFINYDEFYNKEVQLLEPAGTITVEAAAVTTYEDKDIVTRVVADTTDIELEDVKYTNVAKYVGTINYDTIKAAFADGEYLNTGATAGIMINNVKKAVFPEISAETEGTVTYSILFYGITPTDAANLNVSTYYNAHVIKAN